jgi:hypothetical protein
MDTYRYGDGTSVVRPRGSGVEPFTTAALAATLTTLVNGAAGEAGKTAWASMRNFVTTRLARHPQSAEAVAALEASPSDTSAAERLAVSLQGLAHDDQSAAAWIAAWFTDVQTNTPVSNMIAGRARISGNIVQTHTINGDINF